MRVSASYTYPDGSTIEIDICDGLEAFDPLRLKDLTAELRATLRLVLADAAHERAEHSGDANR